MSGSFARRRATASLPARLLALITAGAALFIAVTTLLAIIRAYSPLPIMDQWEQITIAEHLATLFALFNEHRLFVPRLFFMADILVSSGDNRFDLASIFAIQLAHAALLTAIGWGAGLRGAAPLAGVAGAVFAFLLWGQQIENLAWGFQVQFVGVYLAATAAFAALALSRDQALGWVMAVVFAGMAVYSMANGVLAPLLLISLAVWLKRPWPQVAGLVVVAAALLTAYLWGYQTPPTHSDPVETLGHLTRLLRYTLIYLGGPFGQLLETPAGALGLPQGTVVLLSAQIFGGFGLVCLGAMGVAMLARPGLVRPGRLALLHVALFVAGTAAVTALGRASFPLDQAFASRYATPVVVFWTALLLLGWGMRAGWRRPGMPILVVGLVLVLANSQFTMLDGARELGALRRPSTTAVLAHVFDRPAILAIYPAPEVIVPKIRMLEEARLSVFADPWAGWRGTPLVERVVVVEAERCLGLLERASATEGGATEGATTEGAGWRVDGWAWDRQAGAAPSRIVLTDAAGQVVGYAVSGHARSDVPAALAEVTSAEVGWRGHAAGVASELRAFALLDHGRAACPLLSALR